MSNNSTGFLVDMDLGDQRHSICVLDANGEVVSRDIVPNRRPVIVQYFRRFSSPGQVAVAMSPFRKVFPPPLPLPACAVRTQTGGSRAKIGKGRVHCPFSQSSLHRDEPGGGVPRSKSVPGPFCDRALAMETGTHSPWISHLLEDAGFQVLIGNTRKVRAIWGADNKTDDRDAEMLARIARFDPKLLSPITHWARVAHVDLASVKARNALVRSRTDMVNFVRGTLKAAGVSVPACSTEAFSSIVRSIQLAAQGEAFEREGGFTERPYRTRKQRRNRRTN